MPNGFKKKQKTSTVTVLKKEEHKNAVAVAYFNDASRQSNRLSLTLCDGPATRTCAYWHYYE